MTFPEMYQFELSNNIPAKRIVDQPRNFNILMSQPIPNNKS